MSLFRNFLNHYGSSLEMKIQIYLELIGCHNTPVD